MVPLPVTTLSAVPGGESDLVKETLLMSLPVVQLVPGVKPLNELLP